MRPERLFWISLAVAERLKCNMRHSWTSTGRRESVAEHSWRLALMALLVADEFPDVDCGRVVRMCLCTTWAKPSRATFPPSRNGGRTKRTRRRCSPAG